MKKKNLKSLSLNKKSISNMQVSGGRLAVSEQKSVFDINGCMSEGGCTTGDDQTLTCPHHSCACNQK